MRLLIVGGVAGGATAAARARRLDETADIVLFERGADVSFANCGLPYYIGGEITRRDALLVQTIAGLSARFGLDIRTRTEVTRLERSAKQVHARDLNTGRTYVEKYDFLLLSPGAAPIVPPLPGVEHPAISTLRNMADMDRIKARVDHGARTAIVVGGGFIGLEMAENLVRRGLDVTIVELISHVLPPLDPELANRLHTELLRNGVRLQLNSAVVGFENADGGRVRALIRANEAPESPFAQEADLVILAVGVRPDTTLAREAGLELTERGAIRVDAHMRTSDPHIFAVGDAVQTADPVLGGTTFVPLAGPANRQARIAVDNIFGRPSRYRGTLGTSIVRVFGVTAALTGASEQSLSRRGVSFKKIYVTRPNHAGYYPGAQPMTIKLLFAPDDGKILGGQIVGGDGVDKRIDVLAMALQGGLAVFDLEDSELAYAPQFGSAKDPINIAGNVAANVLRGDEQFVGPDELAAAPPGSWTIVDVREPDEFAAGHIPGALHVPLAQLRQHWSALPRDKPIAVYCAVGQRGYYASRLLRLHGLQPRNVAGGFNLYNLMHAKTPPAGPPACAT